MRKLILAALLLFILIGNPLSSQTQHNITLNWNASVTTGVKYNVYRGTASAGPFTPLASDVAAVTYKDTSGTGGTTYWYQITAICDTTTTCPAGVSGESAPTTPVSATFLGNPVGPTGVTATAQ
jgi:fibronectin type 3 domain-containing protein